MYAPPGNTPQTGTLGTIEASNVSASPRPRAPAPPPGGPTGPPSMGTGCGPPRPRASPPPEALFPCPKRGGCLSFQAPPPPGIPATPGFSTLPLERTESRKWAETNFLTLRPARRRRCAPPRRVHGGPPTAPNGGPRPFSQPRAGLRPACAYAPPALDPAVFSYWPLPGPVPHLEGPAPPLRQTGPPQFPQLRPLGPCWPPGRLHPAPAKRTTRFVFPAPLRAKLFRAPETPPWPQTPEERFPLSSGCPPPHPRNPSR